MDNDQALEQFEQAWRAARPLDLRQVVARFGGESSTPHGRRQLAHELVMIDFWHRWRSAARAETGTAGLADTTIEMGQGTSTLNRPWPRYPRLDDYAQRYSDLLEMAEFPAELIGEEYRARRHFGDQPTHQEFLRRFPRQAEALEPLLAKIDLQVSRNSGGSVNSGGRVLPPGNRCQSRGDSSPETGSLPQTIGKYVVLAALDRGGQGQVFRAMHPELRQELAIKLGHPIAGGDRAQQDALVAEARLLAQLDHPNLVRVHDLGFHENCPYVVLDYVPGRNLRELTRSQPLTPERTAEIVVKVARALAIAHSRGITHGDLKPGNILIDERGEPRLIDFGIARERSPWSECQDASDAISGTLLYMAPEQARGDSAEINSRTDVYGLGAVFYELLVGRPPRRIDSAQELIDRACRGDVELAALADPAIPQPLAAVCRQALSPKSEDRQCSVESLADQIDGWRQPRPPAKSRRLLGALAAIAVAVSLAVGAALLANPSSPETSAVITPAEAAAALVGHLPRHDFALKFEVVGHSGTNGIVRPREGENIALKLQSDLDCYVGVWHIDGMGTVTQLFPNDEEQDHFLAANRSLTVPGRNSYSIQVSPGEAPEYLWVAATAHRWQREAGHDLGPAVVLASPDQTEPQGTRAAKLVARHGARVSESVIQIDVRPPAELAVRSPR